MMSNKPLPSFPPTYAKALKFAADRRGWLAYIPVAGLFAILVGVACFIMTPSAFWCPANRGNAIMVYAAILTFSGILLALGWSAFTKNFDIIGRGHLGEFLKENDILDVHLLFISITNWSLTVFSIMTFIGLISLVLCTNVIVMRVVFALMITSAFNAVARSLSLNRFIQELIWDDINQA